MTRGLHTVLFDLDGTLIDSVELILRSYRHTLQHHRGTVPPDEVWLEGLGTPLWEQFRLFTDDPQEIEAMVATYREHNLQHHDALVRVFPGVPEAVDALKARGVRLGVVTSKLRTGTLRGLERCGLDGQFEVLVCADDVTRPKPHPEPVERAVELLGATPATTLFVGDSPHDLAAGRAAGVYTGAVLWGPFPRDWLARHEPDFWFTDPTELTNLPHA